MTHLVTHSAFVYFYNFHVVGYVDDVLNCASKFPFPRVSFIGGTITLRLASELLGLMFSEHFIS